MITLHFMENRVRLHRPAWLGHGFVLTVLFLTSIGIYIGRFLRFHSWHAILQPKDLIAETAACLFEPGRDAMAWPFTLGVFGLLCCIHYSLQAFVHAAHPGNRRTGA